MPERSAATKPVNVALQGGGSHGAFSWGVLDRLLEDGRLDIGAISGTSAGAMNAVAFADGWLRGGADGARERLHEFWRAVGLSGRFSPVQRSPWDVLWGNWSVENSPGYAWYEAWSRLVSPYLANPLNSNPLRDVVERTIDFERVRRCSSPKLFISATNVETGQLRVFRTGELTADVVMASACLPQIFQAVKVDDGYYWDGGYGGNPALYPFFHATQTEDVLLVQINPVLREGVPKSAREIQNRIDEITFNAGLLREFRAIAFVKDLIASGKIEHGLYRDIRMHRIDADAAFKDLSASSKVNAEWAFLEYLRDLGRSAAEDWLAEHYADVGSRATLDLSGLLEDGITTRQPRMGERVRSFLAGRLGPRVTDAGHHGRNRRPALALQDRADDLEIAPGAVQVEAGVFQAHLHAFHRVVEHGCENLGRESLCLEVDAVCLGLDADRIRQRGVETDAPFGHGPGGKLIPGVEKLGAVRRILDLPDRAVEDILAHPFEADGERTRFSQNGPRTLKKLVEEAGSEGGIYVLLVAKQEIEGRPGNLRRPGNVVHRRPRVSVGEEDPERAVENTFTALVRRVGACLFVSGNLDHKALLTK